MANLAKSNALWLQFHLRLAVLLIFGRDWLETRDRYASARTQVAEQDPNANTRAGTAISLSGVKWPTNTDKRFRLFVRITGGSNPRTVKLYKATGGGGSDEVASGTGNSNTDIALTASNSSGITGTYPLASSVTVETDDKHVLKLIQDARPFARAVYDGTDPEGKDTLSVDAIDGFAAETALVAAGRVDAVIRLLNQIMCSDANNNNLVAYGSKFLRVNFANLLTESAGSDASGAVHVSRTGALVALLQDEQDEATGSSQTFVKRVVAAAAGTFGTSNKGLGAIASWVPESHCPTGRLRGECVAGYGDGQGGTERFELRLTSDIDDRVFTFSKQLTIKQSYAGEVGIGGLSAGFTLTRTFSKTGDGSNLNLASVASGFASSGENEANTTGGVVWWKVVDGGGSTFILEFYRTSTMAAGDLVSRSSAVAAVAAFSATQRNASTLALSGTMGSAPVVGATGTFLFNFFQGRNDSGSRDYFEVVISLTSAGDWARVLQRLPIAGQNGWAVDGVTSGAELISDDYINANSLAGLLQSSTN